MPRAATSSSLSPGTLSQCSPLIVWESDSTRDIGREFELPKTYKEFRKNKISGSSKKLTPIAITKLRGLFEKPNAFETRAEQSNETRVWTIKIRGITARSTSLSVVN